MRAKHFVFFLTCIFFCLICSSITLATESKSIKISINDSEDGKNSTRKVRVHFNGLPSKTTGSTIMLRIIRLKDGELIKSIRETSTKSEMLINITDEPSLIMASYTSSDHSVYLEGRSSIYSGNSAEINMGAPGSGSYGGVSASGSSDAELSLATYPPDQGMAIGFNLDDDFRATGSEIDPSLGKGLGSCVITDLVNLNCDDPDSSYVVVESANPAGMKALEEEIKLQSRPEFDQSSRVTPHWIAATHLVKGSFSFGKNSVVVDLQMVDQEGNVVSDATVSGTGDAYAFLDAIDKAVSDLIKKLCESKWTLDINDTIKTEINGYQFTCHLVINAYKNGGKTELGTYQGKANLTYSYQKTVSGVLAIADGKGQGNAAFKVVKFNKEAFEEGSPIASLTPYPYDAMALGQINLSGEADAKATVKGYQWSEHDSGATPIPYKMTVEGGQVKLELTTLAPGKDFQGMITGTPLK